MRLKSKALNLTLMTPNLTKTETSKTLR